MKRAEVIKILVLTLATTSLLVGCTATNGINQLLNNVIGTTAGTMAKAVNTVIPAARSAQASYSQFETVQQYDTEQAKKAAAYDREHSHDQYFQPKASRHNKARRLGTPQQPQRRNQPRFMLNQPPHM